MELAYRPYIDGLRAVAVIAVIIFHLDPALLPGGYLGVDVFFVISGFVISQSLYKTYLKNGRINITSFYIRRFKRLYPALLTMVLTTTLAYAWFGFQWDVNLFLKTALTSILAASNLYFLYRGTDYFHQDLINPLLHTWSLGVEEQFYFVYPFLLAVLLYWVGKKMHDTMKISYLLGFLTLLSLGLFLADFGKWSDFYSPLARFWELGVGCVIFFLSLQGVCKIPHAVPLTFLLMLVPIALSALIDSLHVDVILTVLATAGVIYFGLSDNANQVVTYLGAPLTTYLGRISYSLYLWHLPALYFAYLYLDGVTYYVVALVATFILAMVSYHFVEKPVRYSTLIETMLERGVRYVPHAIAVAVLFLIVVGPSQVRASLNQTFNALTTDFKAVNHIESQFSLGERMQPNYTLNGRPAIECSDEQYYDDLVVDERGLYKRCFKAGQGKDLFYVTGDSHSFHFLSMFDNASVIDDLYFIEVSRQMMVHKDPAQFDMAASEEFFTSQQQTLAQLDEEYESVYLVTSFFLSLHQEQAEHIQQKLEEYVQAMSPHATLIFIAPTPLFASGPESCVLLGKHCTVERTSDEARRQTIFNQYRELAAVNEQVFVYDPYYEICPEEQCRTYDADTDILRYIDKDHISPELSETLAPHFDAWFTETVLAK